MSGNGSAATSPREGNVSLQYPILSKTNYSAWSIKMEVYMEAQGVWEAVVSGEHVEARKDKMALAAIYQGISEDTLLQLGANKTAKEAWNTLKTMHLGADHVKEVRAQGLRWDLESLKMRDNESIDEFTSKIQIIVSRLQSLGEEVEESYVVKKVLRSVSPKFLQIASTIEEFGNINNKSVEEITGSLKAHEERIKGHETETEERVLMTEEEWRSKFNSGPTRRYDPNQNRGSWRGGNNYRGQGRMIGIRGRGFQGDRLRRDVTRVRCFRCCEFGHYAADCKTEFKNDEVHIVEDEPDEPLLLVVEECHSAGTENEISLIGETRVLENQNGGGEELTQSTWYYDTGASNHMTGDKSMLVNYKNTSAGKVRLGDGSFVDIKGSGAVVFKCKNEEHITLTNVHYIPKLKGNIISIGQLDENRASIMIEGGF